MINVGDVILVSLPQETTRGTVQSIAGPNALLVSLDRALVLGKTHDFKMGQTIGAIRSKDMLGRETWEGVSRDDLEKYFSRQKSEKKPAKRKKR